MLDSLASLLPSHDVLTATLWIAAGAVAAAYITARNARLVKISEHRQNWINALRDDLSEYITKADEIQDQTRGLAIAADDQARAKLQIEITEKISRANVLLRKILLRLNPNEDDHITLAKLLSDMRDIKDFERQPGLPDRAVTQAQTVLRREWAVAKYGMWADLRLSLKQIRRRSWKSVRNSWGQARKRLLR